MNNLMTLQEYINNFRRHITPYLKPGVGLTCVSTPAFGQGAVVEFKMAPQVKNEDYFNQAKGTVNDIIKGIPQKLVGGNIDAVRFSGTNISMEPDRIIIIKGEDDPNLYNDKGAKEDVERIVSLITRK